MPSNPSKNRSGNSELTGLLEKLCEAGIDFVLVGGGAAVVQGAPVMTLDLDIVPSTSELNLTKLLKLLLILGAKHRGRPAGQVLHPTREDLAAGGHCLLMTNLGPLDVLGKIEQGLTYLDILDKSVELPFKGYKLKVLGLETIIKLKRSSNRQKDRNSLAVLEETLRRSKRP